MIVFIVLTIIEDIIHYNLGKYSNTKITWKKIFEVPTLKDLIEICIIIVLFSFLQGFLTTRIITLYNKGNN